MLYLTVRTGAVDLEEGPSSSRNNYAERNWRLRRKRLIAAGLTLPVLIIGIIILIKEQPPSTHIPAGAGGGPAAAVETATAAPGTVNRTAAGSVVPTPDMPVTAPQPGWLRKINVTAGDAVKAGDTLAVLEPANDAVSQAQASYESAVSSLRNAQAQLATAQSNLSQAQSDVMTAQSNLDNAKTALSAAKNTEQKAELTAEMASQALADKTKALDNTQALADQGGISSQDLDQVKTAQSRANTANEEAKTALEEARANTKSAGNDIVIAQAALNKANTSLAAAKGAAAAKQKNVDQMQAMVKQARNHINTVQGNTVPVDLRAPSDGIVLTAPLKPDILVTPEQTVVIIKRTGIATAAFDIAAGDSKNIKNGMSVLVRTSIKGKGMPGRVVSIGRSPLNEGESNRVTVEAYDPSDMLKPDRQVIIELIGDRIKAVFVPDPAVMESTAGPAVWVVRRNTVHLNFVKTGGSQGNYTAVISGLKSGDAVVTRTSEQLQEGMRVSVQPSGNTGFGTRIVK